MALLTSSLLTAEAFAKMPASGPAQELVKGQLLTMPPAGFEHGWICSIFAAALHAFVVQHRLGRVLSNDAGVITTRDPDSVRGADVAFYSYDRLPAAQVPNTYPDVPPNLVVEVSSPSDRPREVLTKVSEYLNVGVDVVVVVDPASQSLIIYSQSESPRSLRFSDELSLPDLLPGFSLRLSDYLQPSA